MDAKSNKRQALSGFDSSSQNSQEDNQTWPSASDDVKTSPTSSSSKRSKKGSQNQKRVVSVPFKEAEGGRLKGDQTSSPPPDSWAWRKYGQKPIKGSPYPRGYYRCSSSKGCPARKQVERSGADPNMLVVTYTCEHNHTSPAAARVNLSHLAAVPSQTTMTRANPAVSTSEEDEEDEEEEEEEKIKPDAEHVKVDHIESKEPPKENKLLNIDEGPLISADPDFWWFDDFEPASCLDALEIPKLFDDDDKDVATIFAAGEEDESLFADLGELPECSAVFRRGIAGRSAPGFAAST